MKISFLLLIALVSITLYAQGDTLIGGVDDKLIKIAHNDAGILNYQTIATLPPTCSISKMSWSATNDCFYTLHTPGAVTNQIAKIDANGNYILLGSVTIAGGTVYHLESLMYDSRTSSLYAAASLNGTVPSDYWSESFIKIDTATLEATLIGVFDHPNVVHVPEADNLAHAEDGFFYYTDSEAGVAPFLRIFKQDISMTSDAVMIYEDPSGGNIGDITVKGGYLYFAVNRVLRRIDLSNNTHSVVGTMFSASDFGGLQMTGMDWRHNFYATVESTNERPALTVYPNPSNGIFRIELTDEEITTLTVYDLKGSLVKVLYPNVNQFELDLMGFESGEYFLEAKTIEGRVINVKVKLVD